jgi:hypothetical protein
MNFTLKVSSLAKQILLGSHGVKFDDESKNEEEKEVSEPLEVASRAVLLPPFQQLQVERLPEIEANGAETRQPQEEAAHGYEDCTTFQTHEPIDSDDFELLQPPSRTFPTTAGYSSPGSDTFRLDFFRSPSSTSHQIPASPDNNSKRQLSPEISTSPVLGQKRFLSSEFFRDDGDRRRRAKISGRNLSRPSREPLLESADSPAIPDSALGRQLDLMPKLRRAPARAQSNVTSRKFRPST